MPFNYTQYIDDVTSLVKKGIINMSRIDDAVRRILRVKFIMGLFENPLADLSFADQLGKKVDNYNMLYTPQSKFHKTTNTLVKLSQNHRFKVMYHRTTYLTINLSHNYKFKAKYRKTTDLIIKLLSQNYKFWGLNP